MTCIIHSNSDFSTIGSWKSEIVHCLCRSGLDKPTILYNIWYCFIYEISMLGHAETERSTTYQTEIKPNAKPWGFARCQKNLWFARDGCPPRTQSNNDLRPPIHLKWCIRYSDIKADIELLPWHPNLNTTSISVKNNLDDKGKYSGSGRLLYRF